MASQFDYWKRALAGEKVDYHEGVVMSGYWRVRGKEGWRAVGIWRGKDAAGELIEPPVVRLDGQPFRETEKWTNADLYQRACRDPITFALYQSVVKDGQPWPDMPPPLPDTRTFKVEEFKTAERITDEQMAEGVRSVAERNRLSDSRGNIPAADRVVERTDNQPPEEVDPYKVAVAELQEEERLVAVFLKSPITTQEQADKAANWADRIGKRKKWFDDEYWKINRPLVDRQTEIRTLYLRPKETAEALAKDLTRATSTFLAAEQKRLDDERAAKQREEAARLQALADEAREKGETLQPDQVAAVMPTTAEPPKKATAGGATGRKTTVAVEQTGTVEDYLRFAKFLIYGTMENPPFNYCSNADLKRVLDDLAKKVAKVALPDMTLPGVVISKQPKARR